MARGSRRPSVLRIVQTTLERRPAPRIFEESDPPDAAVEHVIHPPAESHPRHAACPSHNEPQPKEVCVVIIISVIRGLAPWPYLGSS